MTRILFVCTGNICRSPTAEGVLLHRLKNRDPGLIAHVDSAGTSGYHTGHAPDPRTIEAAFRRGYDLSPLRARQVQLQDFTDFELILAMDRSHYAALAQMADETARERVKMFLDFAPGAAGRDVPDPYYGSSADFEHVLDLVEQGVDGLLNYLGYN